MYCGLTHLVNPEYRVGVVTIEVCDVNDVAPRFINTVFTAGNMGIYTWVYICACMCVCIWCMCLSMSVGTCVYVYTCVHIVYVCVYVPMCVTTHTYAGVSVTTDLGDTIFELQVCLHKIYSQQLIVRMLLRQLIQKMVISALCGTGVLPQRHDSTSPGRQEILFPTKSPKEMRVHRSNTRLKHMTTKASNQVFQHVKQLQ